MINLEEWMAGNNAKIYVLPVIGPSSKIMGKFTWRLDYEEDGINSICGNTYDDLIKNVEYHIYDKYHNKFYLEISGRQSGKTTRLIEAMNQHIRYGGVCTLFLVVVDKLKIF